MLAGDTASESSVVLELPIITPPVCVCLRKGVCRDYVIVGWGLSVFNLIVTHLFFPQWVLRGTGCLPHVYQQQPGEEEALPI